MKTVYDDVTLLCHIYITRLRATPSLWFWHPSISGEKRHWRKGKIIIRRPWMSRQLELINSLTVSFYLNKYFYFRQTLLAAHSPPIILWFLLSLISILLCLQLKKRMVAAVKGQPQSLSFHSIGIKDGQTASHHHTFSNCLQQCRTFPIQKWNS